jgi:hypothetical protein
MGVLSIFNAVVIQVTGHIMMQSLEQGLAIIPKERNFRVLVTFLNNRQPRSLQQDNHTKAGSLFPPGLPIIFSRPSIE